MDLLHLSANYVLEFVPVFLEGSYALAQQVAGHFALVHLIPKVLFSRYYPLNFLFSCEGLAEFEWNLTVGVLQLFKQGRRDGESVTATEFLDFSCTSERSSHYESFDSKVLIVVVYFSD